MSGEATLEFMKLMSRFEEAMAELRDIGESIDFEHEPYPDEELKKIALLGMRFDHIGNVYMMASEMIAETLAAGVSDTHGISLNKWLDDHFEEV